MRVIDPWLEGFLSGLADRSSTALPFSEDETLGSSPHLKEFLMRRFRATLATSFAALAIGMPAAPSFGAPPEDFEFSETLPAGAVCDFPLEIEASGKSKVLDRGDHIIITGPRNVAVLANAETGTSTTVRIGGIFKDKDLGGGMVATVSTGRNVVLTANAGAVLLVGRYEFTLDEKTGELVGDYEGRGQIIDLCAALS